MTPAEPAVPPALPEALCAVPQFLHDEPVVPHLPLLFWLCAAVRPGAVAVLGAGGGTAHFALCQAMDIVGGPGRCTGFGLWGGGPGQVPDALAAHAARHHPERSRLVAVASAEEALSALPPASQDIVLAESAACAGLPEPGLAPLLPVLRDGGILLLHGVGPGTPPDMPDGLEGRYVVFPAGQGLWCICPGTPTPPAVARLCALTGPDGLLPDAMGATWETVGRGLADRARRLKAEAGQAAARSALETARAVHYREMAEMTAIAEEIRKRSSARDEALAAATARAEELRARLDAAERDLAQSRRALVEAETARDQVRRDAEAQMQTLLGSTSWRVTAPLRRMAGLVRR